MKISNSFYAIFLAFLFLIFSCKSQKNASSSVVPSDTIKITLNDTLNISLEDNPSTGYMWRYNDEKNKYLLFSEFTVMEDSNDSIVGRGVVRTFTFIPQKKGKTEIVFHKSRGKQKPVESKAFFIIIEKSGD